jgi:hypothetical protein
MIADGLLKGKEDAKPSLMTKHSKPSSPKNQRTFSGQFSAAIPCRMFHLQFSSLFHSVPEKEVRDKFNSEKLPFRLINPKMRN